MGWNVDWTALALGALGLVISFVGWVLRQSFTEVKDHMKSVETFMSQSSQRQAVVETKLANVEWWMQGVDQRISSAREITEMHGWVRDMHGKERQ